MTDTIRIHPIPALKDNYIWALIDPAKQTAVIVDPGESEPVSAFLNEKQLTLKAILITHHHWDHTNGVMPLKDAYHVPVYGSKTEHIASVTIPVDEKSRVVIDDFSANFQVIAIPGHTLGHIAYYAPGMVFCGDTLFAAGCGRVFEGTMDEMYASLQKIAHLPDDTNVFCAHEYTLNNLRFAKLVEPGNLEIEKRTHIVSDLRKKNLPSLPSLLHDEKTTNPFLRCDAKEIITNVEKHVGRTLKSPIDVFTGLRKWKDIF